MTFAEVYITIYRSAIMGFYLTINNTNNSEMNFNSHTKYFAFVRFTLFIKYKFKSAHNKVDGSARIN